MKTRSFFYSMFFAAFTLLWISSCSGKKDEGTHDQHEMPQSHEPETTIEASAPQFQVEDAFQTQLANVFASYVEIKDALVTGDAEKVKHQAEETEEALAKVDMKLLTGAAHNDWMVYLRPMQASLSDIRGTDDIEAQRRSFSTLSENLYKSISAFGLNGKEAYYDFCPMAFDNAGAYWLSDNKEIRNPYFGDKMLTCGEVKERLQ